MKLCKNQGYAYSISSWCKRFELRYTTLAKLPMFVYVFCAIIAWKQTYVTALVAYVIALVTLKKNTK